MTSTNQLLGKNAAPYTLEHGGRVYRFRLLGQVEKSAFRAWLLSRTRAVLCVLYSGAELEEQLRTLTADAIAGVYDFGGEVATRVLATFEGLNVLTALLAGCEPDELLDLLADREQEVRHLLELVMAESARRHGMKPASSSVDSVPASRGRDAGGDQEGRPFPRT
jgi:hypothetical protein